MPRAPACGTNPRDPTRDETGKLYTGKPRDTGRGVYELDGGVLSELSVSAVTVGVAVCIWLSPPVYCIVLCIVLEDSENLTYADAVDLVGWVEVKVAIDRWVGRVWVVMG